MLWSLSAARARHAVGAVKAPTVRRALDPAKTANMPCKGDGPRDKTLDRDIPISGRPSIALAFLRSERFRRPRLLILALFGRAHARVPYEWPTN